MKYAVLLLLLLGGPGWRLLTRVRDRNVAVADGTAAYGRGDAGAGGHGLCGGPGGAGQPHSPTRAWCSTWRHAQALAGQRAPRSASYGRLLAGSPRRLGSVARQQLAVLAAQRGELAQALSLLRQALLLDPANTGARYDYEAAERLPGPAAQHARRFGPAQAATGSSQAQADSPEKNSAEKNKPAEKAGTDRQGEVNDHKPAPPSPTRPRQPRPTRPASRTTSGPLPRPATRPPAAAQPGAGTAAARGQRRHARHPAGAGPHQRRGRAGSRGRSSRPGTEAATAADLQLQTQRERLQAMNLSPAQARQLLETLRAQEQQYLQQLTRPAAQKPDPSKPTW